MLSKQLMIAVTSHRYPNPSTVIDATPDLWIGVILIAVVEFVIRVGWTNVSTVGLVDALLDVFTGLMVGISADLPGSVEIVRLAARVVALKLFVPQS